MDDKKFDDWAYGTMKQRVYFDNGRFSYNPPSYSSSYSLNINPRDVKQEGDKFYVYKNAAVFANQANDYTDADKMGEFKATSIPFKTIWDATNKENDRRNNSESPYDFERERSLINSLLPQQAKDKKPSKIKMKLKKILSCLIRG